MRFRGRTGNQLFQYAFARAIQEKYYPSYEIILNFVEYEGLKLGDCNFLQHFRIQECKPVIIPFKKCLTPVQFCVQAFRSLFTRCTLKFFPDRAYKIDAAFMQRIMNFFGQYEPLFDSRYVKPYPSKFKNIVLSAYFEAYEYFDSIRDILLEEFVPKYDVLPHNKALLENICNSESVCVHVRRGDFLALSQFNVCNEEYFITAMKAIREELPKCKFFVFSDDIDTVKNTMHLPFEAEYVSSDIPSCETLRLMYNCKHFIISNSTFSWWAQYLSRNENKIVYAPTPWRWGEDCSGMYMPYMRTIECRKK